MLVKTDCEIKALADIRDSIKELASSKHKYNQIAYPGKSVRILYQGENSYKNANIIKRAINNKFSPKTFKNASEVVKVNGGHEVVYDISYDLVKSQELVNNSKKEVLEDKLEEQNKKLLEETLESVRYDIFDKEGNLGFEIINKNGVIQHISKLTSIEDLNEYQKQRFNLKDKQYLYTSVINPKTKEPVINNDQQDLIVQQLTGIVLDIVANDLLNNKSANVFYKEGENSVLNVRKFLIKRIAELNNKYKEKTATPQETEEFILLTGLFKIDDFLRFQEDVINRLKAKGYKFEEGSLKISKEEENVKDLQDQLTENDNEDFEMSEDVTGKTDQMSDYSAFTTSNKEKMSGRLRTFLSSIKSEEPSLLTLNSDTKTYNTQYVKEDTVIQAVNESLVGVNTFDKVIQNLDEGSKTYKGREFLAQVKERLLLEKEKGSEIVSQFIDKFNQQKNDLTITQYTKKPTIAQSFINKEGVKINIPLRDKEGNVMFYYDYKVINANRNDIATNLKEAAEQNFVEGNNLDEEIIPKSVTKFIYDEYLEFKEYAKNNYTTKGFNDVSEAKQKLKSLFSKINVELSEELLEELLSNKRNRIYVNFNFNVKDTNSVFHNKFGMFTHIFANLNEEATLDDVFGNSGINKLFKLEAEFQEYYYNISTLDGKGRNIWGYSMPSPFFRSLFEILNDDEKQELAGDKNKSLFTSSSYILQKLNRLNTEERKLFKENIKYSLFNTLKTGGEEGKELGEMEDQEFIISQIISLIGSDIKTSGDVYWSNKFLTTPSDKSTMYLIQTPNHNIPVANEKVNITVDSEITQVFYNYFQGEYRRAITYQNGTPEYKQAVDDRMTSEPMLFYNFPQLNVKSKDNPLWRKENNTWLLRGLNEEISSGITVEDYVKIELLKQLKKEIETTRKKLEGTGVIANNVFVNGFPNNYRKRVPLAVSLNKEINNVKKEIYHAGGKEEKEFLLEKLNDVYEKSNVLLTDYLVADYALNYLLHNIEMLTLLIGDPTQYLKNEKQKFKNNPKIFNSSNVLDFVNYIDAIRVNHSKRMAGLQGNRMEGDLSEFKTTTTVVVEDIVTPSKILKEIQKFNPNQVDKYASIKSMDGGGIITAEEDLRQKLIHGKIDKPTYQKMFDKVQKQHEDIKKNGRVLEENKFTKEEKLIAQPIKPMVFGNIYDPIIKDFKTTYYKDSEFALYPELTQEFEIDKLREGLYDLSQKGVYVDRLVTKTATKVGAKKPIKGLFNPDMSINENVLETITDENIDVIPRNLQGIQLEIPYEPNKREIRVASQQIKLIFNEIQNLSWANQAGLIDKFLPELKGQKVTGKLLKTYHNNVYKQLIETSLEDVLEDIGIDFNVTTGEYTFENLEKLQKTLEITAIELGYSKPTLEGLSLTPDKKEFILPISFNESSDRLEKLLLSLLNKAILQKIHGRSFILAPEMGFVPKNTFLDKLKEENKDSKDITEKGVVEGETAKKLIKQYSSSIVFTKNFDFKQGLLPSRRSNPNDKNSEILPAQVLVSWKFKDLDINDFTTTDENGRVFIDTSKVDENVLRVLGIRIPTQGHPSMSSIEIVGFLPEFMADMIVAPQDFVAMMGSDFDIDKLYGYTYNYIVDEETGKLEKLRPFSELSDKTKLSLVKSKKLTKEYLKKLRNEEEIYQDILKELEDKKEEQKTAYENLKKIKQDLKENEKELITEDFNSLIENKKYLIEKKNEVKAEINAINEYLGSIYEESEEGAKVKGKYREDFKAKEERRKYLFNINKDINEAIKKVDNYLSQIKSIKNPYLEDLISKQEATKNIKNELTQEEINIILDNLGEFENKTDIRKKLLQNKLQDIYHTIMLHPSVLDKSLEGITEGKLGELAAGLKAIRQTKDVEYYSPSSVTNKIDEFFENKAGKMGVGVFSVNSTFLTVIENLGLELQTTVFEENNNGKFIKKEVPDPFIIKVNDENFEFYKMSSAKGVNKLISMFQSASVDNANLNYLYWISVNKDTMGVAALLSSLADDSVTDENNVPILNEDYIVYFLSQPIIQEYIKIVNLNSKFSEFVNVDEKVSSLLDNYKDRVQANLELENTPEEESSYFLNLLKNSPNYTLEELKEFVKEENSLQDSYRYLTAQYRILNKFIALKEQSDVVRSLQYLVNADSKGVPSSLAEANYKEKRKQEMLLGSPLIKNVEKVFLNIRDEDTDVTENQNFTEVKNLTEDNGINTLQGYISNIANDISVKIFSKNNAILASGSKHVEELVESIYKLTGRKSENYSYKFVNKLTKSYLAYLQSTSNLQIQDRGITFKEEIKNLLSPEIGLGNAITQFKSTPEYKTSSLLKPFFESLQIKNQDGLKFVEFKASQGLVNTDEQIVQGLNYLRKINTPLFNQLIKYALLVKIENSPISFKKFIPIYYKEAIGLTDSLREINSKLNTTLPKDNVTDPTLIQATLLYFEADALPVYAFTEQFLQHYPEETKSLAFQDFTYLDINNKPTKELTENINIKGEFRVKYTNVTNGKEFYLPYLSVYNYEEKRYNLFKKLDNDGNYTKISNLGQYNIDEFDSDTKTTATSILPKNEVKGISQIKETPTQIVDKNQIYSQLGNKTQSENVILPKDLEDNTVYEGKNFWNEIVPEAKSMFDRKFPGQKPMIIAFRGNSKKSFLQNYKDQFVVGNPFNWQDEKGNRSEQGIISTKKFIEWLTTGNSFGNKDATEEYRQAIINDIKSGEIVKSPILYYEEKGYATHATALDYLINKYDWNNKTADKNQLQKQIDFQEEPTTGYRQRTINNAKADATIAIAVDFTSAGEKLTKTSVLNQNKKYIPIDANILTVTKERVDKIVEQLNSVNAKTLNIAGNGIYTMKGKYTQQQIDDFTYDLLNQVLNSPNLKTKIESIRSGGQTGFDEAGAKAGIKLKLPTIVLAPKGWTFRNINGQDISNEQQFKGRFKNISQVVDSGINEREYTSENITSLKPNEVFVFGANTVGGHGGGTAGLAQRGTTASNYTALPVGTKGKWAEYGVVDKLMQGTEGKSFGIVTKAASITGTSLKIGSKRSVPLSRIEKSIKALIEIANKNPNLKFLVTKFGTNMAGFSEQEMKSLLENKNLPDNIILPKEFEVRQELKPNVVEEVKPTNLPIRELGVFINNEEAKINNILSGYGVIENQTGEQKVNTLLDKISKDSKSPYFSELAKLLIQLNEKFKFTNNINVNLVKDVDSHYDPNTHTINLNTSQTDKFGKPLPEFSERMQYEILHELLHSLLDGRLGKEEAGNILKNRIKRLIGALQSEESLQKAIDLFELKDETGNIATPQYLLNKLNTLREESQDVEGIKYLNEAERSILNPLINEREFLVNVLGDNNTRQWMNEIPYEENKTLFDKIWETINVFFNNLIRTFGFEIKDKSTLQEALKIVFDVINYEEDNLTTTEEFTEFGTIYKFTIDKNGNVVSGEYSQGNRNNFNPLSKPTKKYLELVESKNSEKLIKQVAKKETNTVNLPTKSGKTLQGEQVQAFEKAMAWFEKPANTENTEEAILDNMFFLSGAGGSGKTFITEIVLEQLLTKIDPNSVIATAPTHQAKNVLKENIQKTIESTTIQSLLGLLPNPVNKSSFISNTLNIVEGLYYEGKAPKIFNYDFIVLDEASMVDGRNKLVQKEYKNVWSDITNSYVTQDFYENPDLGTYLKQLIELKFKLTGKPTKVFLMGDVAQVVPVGSGRFEISKLLTDLLKKEDNTALLTEIRRTDNQEVKKLSLAFRESFNTLFKDNNANPEFIKIINLVKPGNKITLLNNKKEVIDKFIELYKENINSGSPIPNFTNIIWYNNSVNVKTVDQTKLIRQILFNNDLEINVNENLILKSNITLKNFFGEGKDLFIGTDTKFITTAIEDKKVNISIGKKGRLVSNIPVKSVTANAQIGSTVVKDVKFNIVTPSYYKFITDKFKNSDKTVDVEGQTLTKKELYEFAEVLNNVEYGYIINTHKVQGSKVINPIVDIQNIVSSPEDLLHMNNMIYTAISRTVDSLYIFHPLLTPVEGKPISKLTGVNNLNILTTEDTTKDVEISTDYFKQRLNRLYEKQTRIYTDKTLTEEEKLNKLREVDITIARVQQNVDMLENNYTASEFFRVAQKELADLRQILKNYENLSVEDANQAIQIFNYFDILYSQLNSENTNYYNDNYTGEKVYVSPELMVKVEAYHKITEGLKDSLKKGASKTFIGTYNNITGKTTTEEDFFLTEKSSSYRRNFLSTNKNKQQGVRAVSRIVTEVLRDSKQAIINHEQDDIELIRNFEKQFSFKDFIRFINYTDVNGLKVNKSTLISRNKLDFYNKIAQVYKDAKNETDFKQKNKFIRKELSKISYEVDVRYLLPEEYNREMKEYYNDENIEWTNQNSKDIYFNNFSDFHKKQFSEYGESYAEYRMNEVILQARQKMDKYFSSKEIFFESLQNQKLTDQEKKDKLQDWISYNSPFLLLNEIIPLKKEDGALTNRIVESVPQEVNTKTFTTKKGKVITIRPDIDYKKRNARNFITTKAKNKNEAGETTDFYDGEYMTMEQEYIQKENNILDFETNGDVVSAEKEKERIIKWEYFKFIEQKRKYYLDMLPHHLTKELKWYDLMDVEKNYQEQFSDIITPILNLDRNLVDFVKTDLLKLMSLGFNFIYDEAVKTMWDKHIAEKEEYIDFITKQVKLSYNPSGFSNALNNADMGNLRTTDVFNYFDQLRNAAISFKERNKMEELIKLGQFVNTLPMLDKHSKNKDIELTQSELGALNWAVNSKIYGAKREEIYLGTEHNLSKKITSKASNLTKQEREKLQTLYENLEYYNSLMPTINDEKILGQITEKILLINRQIKNIKRERTWYTRFNTYSKYVSLKYLSFGIAGRFVDFGATLMNGIKQAVDGRIYGFESYGKSLSKIMYLYSPNAVSSMTTAAGVVSLNPVIALSGFAGRMGAGVINKTFREKDVAKFNQILYRLGALDYFDYTQDDNVSSFVTKQNLTDEFIESLKTFSPFSTIAQVEIINKGIPSLAVMYEEKIKDKTGQERPLIDAFTVNENLNLIWNTEEFEENEDYNWYSGNKMRTIVAKALSAQTFSGGDYDTTTAKYGDTDLRVKAVSMLRKFFWEFINSRIGSTTEEETTGLKTMGMYRAAVLSIRQKTPYKKQETNEERQIREIAIKQIIFDVGYLLALNLVVVNLISMFSSIGSDDDDDKGLEELDFLEKLDYFVTKSIERLTKENLQFFNPDIVQGKIQSGLISPLFSDGMQFYRILESVYKSMYGDVYLSHAEMVSKGLAPRNSILYSYEYDDVNNPGKTKTKTKYIDPKTGETKRISNSGKKIPLGKYSREYEQQSRLLYNVKRMFPFFNLILKDQRQKNEMVKKVEK